MKSYIFICISVLCLGIKAQVFNCGSRTLFRNESDSTPYNKNRNKDLEMFTKSYITKNTHSISASTPSVFIIPVVFHVVYSTLAGNISSAQIINQMNILNKEFKRQQADTILTPPAFLPLAGKLNIEFRLATKDPNGNCTDGINRVYSSLSACAANSEVVKSLAWWPNDQYLNIWVVQGVNIPSIGCAISAYSSFPGDPPSTDGIIIRNDIIGTIGTGLGGFSNYDKGRILIHEIGHYLNLNHIWGDTFCGDDLVSDTPPAVMENYNCPIFPKNPNNSCGSNSNGEMFNNYMDYTDDNCLNMFTQGQVLRMMAALNSTVSGRKNLWSTNNLISTGTADPYIYPINNCVSNPNINPIEPVIICVGDSVKFTDISSGGISTARTWGFFGGNINTSVDSIVTVKYNSPGTYNVILSNSFSSSTKTQTFTNRVHVLNPASTSNSLVLEGFENQIDFNTNWRTVNLNNDASNWDFNYSTSYSGSSCYFLNNFLITGPSKDEFISPGYDLSGASSASLSFMYSYAEAASSSNDNFVVLVSNNCGKIWTPIFSKTGSSLRTVASSYSVSFVPTPSSNQWKQEIIVLNEGNLSNKTYFKFLFNTGKNGNNFYIDNINIATDNFVGINRKNIDNFKFLIYPNPIKRNLQISNIDQTKGFFDIKIEDLLGKIMFSEKNINFNLGVEKHTIDLINLAEGVYFLTISDKKGYSTVRKIVKEN